MMRVSFERLHDGIRFTTFCEEADKSKSPKFGSHRDFQYRSSNGAEFPDTHPDRLALVALLNTLPFAGERLHIGWPVSERFLEAVQLISRVEVVSEKAHRHQLAAPHLAGMPSRSAVVRTPWPP